MTEIITNTYKPKKYLKEIEPFTYSPSFFGMTGRCTGSKTKISIISSGLPDHQDLGEFSDVELFINGTDCPDDMIGTSTMYAGIIAAHGKTGITGLAPKTKVYYAKCINEKKICTTNAVTASILWSIIQEVDVILLGILPIEQIDALEAALEKASKTNIPVFTEFNDNLDKKITKNNFLLPVIGEINKDFSIRNDNGVLCIGSPEATITTSPAGKYSETSQSIAATSIAAGLALLLIQKHKNSNEEYNPGSIYKELLGFESIKRNK